MKNACTCDGLRSCAICEEREARKDRADNFPMFFPIGVDFGNLLQSAKRRERKAAKAKLARVVHKPTQIRRVPGAFKRWLICWGVVQ